MNIAFRFLLTFNATSLLAIVFFVKSGFSLRYFLGNIGIDVPIPNFIFYLFYLSIPVFLTWVSILVSSYLSRVEIEEDSIVEIAHANNSFLPSYLGYFFVGLSIPNVETLVFVYGVLFVFTFRSQALYFNPLFLIFGFEFYNVKTQKGADLFLISRKSYKLPSEVVAEIAYRINDHTFIQRNR